MTLSQEAIDKIQDPRGLSRFGPILFSYGFRPFFLGGASWACVSMILWIASLSTDIGIGGGYGARAWHAHEMLFGFGSAIVAGFLLTATPNWTGRLPISGPPLMLLFLLWAAGRLALLFPDTLGVVPSVMIEAAFLPVMTIVCVREIIAGRKWADLKVMAGLGALALANLCFHYEVIAEGGPVHAGRLAVSAYLMMIIVVGGRMLPSFTRNWLAKAGKTSFPTPHNQYDATAILASLPALALWIMLPDERITGAAALAAAALHAARLIRWKGWTTGREPLVSVLHLAYAFIPLGFLAIAATAFDVLDPVSSLHVLTVGSVATMMLAVMTRATRGHTGRALTASRMTCLSYAALFVCAFIRPLAGLFPDQLSLIYAAAGMLWVGGFGLYLWEYGPMLVNRRRQSIGG
ncbi:uncharacterized protein involved in response to NO [Rhizobium sp. SG_E_25_P2]|uniref:NnrS family protein n=1 Tax=Rhizobium sp. SG_E_25_P2 TaxID=2879942 RepID=UPI002472F660|nr:NnrS family protein [Rhizobium sp. SG_E_25_P2]MDH6268182.1 uncharacterized protein involved in response to NO [Rhizobium sp. SG_E_25_P2]